MATFTNELWDTFRLAAMNLTGRWDSRSGTTSSLVSTRFAPTSRKGRIALAGLAALIAGPKICLCIFHSGFWRWLLNFDYPNSTFWLAFLQAWPGTFLATAVLYLLARKCSAPLDSVDVFTGLANMKTFMTVVHFHFIGLLFSLNLISFHARHAWGGLPLWPRNGKSRSNGWLAPRSPCIWPINPCC